MNRRKAFIKFFVSVICLFVFSFCIHIPSDPDEEGSEEKVTTLAPGIVITDAVITAQADGRRIIVTVSTGVNGRLNIIDEQEAKVIHSAPLMSTNDEITIWGYAVLANRHVVVSTSRGELFDIDPDNFRIKQASPKPGGATYFWDLTTDNEAMVYVGTYPTGQVLGYNTIDDSWIDFGVVSEGNLYVKSLTYDKYNEEGYLYAGTGTKDVAVWKINVKTKSKVKLPKPPGLKDDNKFIYNLSSHNNYIYVLGTNDVFDVKNNQWFDKLEASVGYNARAIKVSFDGNSVYYLKRQDNVHYQLMLYNPDTKSKVLIKSNIKQQRLVDSYLLDDHKVLMTDHKNGELNIYDIAENTVPKQLSGIVAGPRLVHAMSIGPDGKIYVSAYMPTVLMCQIDPFLPVQNSAKLISHQYGQIEGFGMSGEWLLMGLYSRGSIASYNPKTKQYRKEVVIANQQQRPYAITDINGSLAAVGTVPGYGLLGGALTIYNVKNNKIEAVYKDDLLVPKQAVISLASKDGVVYGGTSVEGGLGIKPEEKSAKVFSFDVKTRQLIASLIPIVGAKHISALRFGPNGNLYGIANGGIFEINPHSMELVKVKKYDDKRGHKIEAIYLKDNLIYAKMGPLGIYEIEPNTFERKLLVADARTFVISKDGYLYFSRGADIMRLLIKKKPQ